MKKNAGVTTIIVVCAMAIIMALSLGLFLTASVLVKTAQQTGAKEQSRILAVSLSKEAERQLTSPEKTFANRIDEEADKMQDVRGLSLWHYVKQNISSGSWPYFEDSGETLHNRENAVRTFSLQDSGSASEIAETELSLYWIKGGAENVPEALVIRTKVTVKEQSCIITDTYKLQIAGEDYEAWTWQHVDKR